MPVFEGIIQVKALVSIYYVVVNQLFMLFIGMSEFGLARIFVCYIGQI